VIDSVMDIDYAAGRISYKSADAIIDYFRLNRLKVEWLIETHAHADHLSAAPYIQQKVGGKLGIGEHIITVQKTFGKVFNEGTEFQRDGSQFDRLFKDGDTYAIGGMTAFVMHTPGHTPACTTHVIGDAAFVGDTLFMPEAVPHAPTSPAATRRFCSDPSARFWRRYRPKPASSCATTMVPTVARSVGRPVSARSESTTFMSATA
jgi:glyoxylase-like metal-dependent hydrolase (beta-lactamase superfamily II)